MREIKRNINEQSAKLNLEIKILELEKDIEMEFEHQPLSAHDIDALDEKLTQLQQEVRKLERIISETFDEKHPSQKPLLQQLEKVYQIYRDTILYHKLNKLINQYFTELQIDKQQMSDYKSCHSKIEKYQSYKNTLAFYYFDLQKLSISNPSFGALLQDKIADFNQKVNAWTLAVKTIHKLLVSDTNLISSLIQKLERGFPEIMPSQDRKFKISSLFKKFSVISKQSSSENSSTSSSSSNSSESHSKPLPLTGFNPH